MEDVSRGAPVWSFGIAAFRPEALQERVDCKIGDAAGSGLFVRKHQVVRLCRLVATLSRIRASPRRGDYTEAK